MIPRITRGGSAYGALHYDHGPGRRDEHKNAHKVAGTVAGKTWKQRAHAIDEHIKTTRPGLTKPIVRTSLRLAQEDRKLTDKEWRQVAERYADRMGFKDCPWEAVRHADDHIHLTISRVSWDGKVIDQWHNYDKAQTTVRGIEKKHQLVNAAERYRRTGQAEISRNDHAPQKESLRERVMAAEQASNGTRASYESELAKRDVQYRANVSKPTEKNPHGKMNGYSYGVPDHRDAQGEQVWFKGSQLGRNHGWTATERRLAERAKTREHDATTASEGKAAKPSRQPARRAQAVNEHRGVSDGRGTQRPKYERAQGEHDRTTSRPAERSDQGAHGQQPSVPPHQQREDARARARERARLQVEARRSRTTASEQQAPRSDAQSDQRPEHRSERQQQQPKENKVMMNQTPKSDATHGKDAARERAQEKAREQVAERRAKREQQRDRDKDQGIER